MKTATHPASRVETELRRCRPNDPLPVGLHESVMRAVQAAGASQTQGAVPALWRWLTVPALAALAAVCIWWMQSEPPAKSGPMTTAGAVLAQTHAMPRQASAAMLAPLSQELESLNRDLQCAVDFLVASVP